MHVGSIGGIGFAATIRCYQCLTAAVAARGFDRPDLTIAHGDIEELIRDSLGATG